MERNGLIGCELDWGVWCFGGRVRGVVDSVRGVESSASQRKRDLGGGRQVGG